MSKPAQTTTRKCTYRRCDGGTVILASGMPVECQRCGGTGRMASVDELRRADAELSRRGRLLEQLRTRVRELAGGRGSDAETDMANGRGLLEDREPERHARMLDAIEAGRTDAVITCLQSYWREHTAG